MKKWILGILAVAVIVTIGFSLFRTNGLIENSGDYYYPRYGMMGGFYDDYCHNEYMDGEEYDFDWLYMHLSETDQALIDVMYADSLATYDFSTMTDEEKTDTIAMIKADLADYIIDNDLIELP